MSRTVKRHKFWLIPVCVLAATAVMLTGWSQLYAQDPGQPPAPGVPGDPNAMPGAPADPNAAGAAPAPAAPAEPTIPFAAVVPPGAKTADVKNWDGQVTSIIRFKYKTLDNRLITVHLPATYKAQPMTRAGWDTLFQCFSMDVEAAIAAKEGKKFEIGGQAIKQMMDQLRQERPEEEDSSSNPAAGVRDFAQANLPDIAASGYISLPPLLGGMY